jgi:peptidoglycan/xylan/chitin deacetylase (PgdA/CDA1 family)
MSTLQLCWVAVTAVTIIFVIVAAISALPKMKAAWTAAIAAIFLGASGITAFGAITPLLPSAVASLLPRAHAAGYQLPPVPAPGAPLDNDASAGWVTFTFDDGPDVNTGRVIAELNALRLHGVFFVIGDKAARHPDIIRAEVANGEVVGNHTWDHKSLTGKGTGKPPLTPAQVRAELTRANDAIVAAGAPKPTLWRPPYGGVNAADDAIARPLGLRVVLDSGANIVDSNDWAGLNARQIAARVDPVLRDGTIVAFHDGLSPAGTQTAEALPLIVSYMNAHHLGETADVRPDATGGIVPYAGPPLAVHDTWPVPPAKRHLATGPLLAGPAANPGAAPAASPVTAGAPPPSVITTAPAAPGPSPSRSRTSSAPNPTTPAPTPTPTKPAPTPTPTKPAPTPTPTKPAPTPTTPAPTATPTGLAPTSPAPTTTGGTS